jgi:2,5-diketo-D-gluconate reductase A
LFHNSVLAGIASKYNKSIGQVVLRWLVQRGIVALAKTVKRERMEENLDVFDFMLTEEDTSAIATLETGNSSFFSHQDPAMVKWMARHD